MSIVLGSVIQLPVVWAIADWMSALCAIINIYAVVRLSKWSIGALRDYQAQRNAGTALDDIIFVSDHNPYLPGELPSDLWSRKEWAATVEAHVKDAPHTHEDFLEWYVRQSD